MTNPALHVPLIHVVDDDADFRVAITRLLRTAGYDVRCYPSAGDFLVTPIDDRPACILLDLNMPGPNGLEMQAALARMERRRPIVFLSGYGDIPTTVRAMKGGAVDFLSKPVARETLLLAIENALSQDVAGRREQELVGEWHARLLTLTPREREVLERVVAGKLNKVIGAELGTAERTVKTHRARVMEKFGASSLAELVQIIDRLRAAGVMHAVSGTNH